MQSDARDSFKRRFATRKQEVQSLALSGFSEPQIVSATGINRRNVYKYTNESSSPRALPRALSNIELSDYSQQVGTPMYMSTAAPDSHIIGCMSIVTNAEKTVTARKAKLVTRGMEVKPVEDVEHYYEKRIKHLLNKTGDHEEES